MRFQFVERHGLMNRRAVVEYVQAVLAEVYNSVSIRPLNVGVSNIPFLRHYPVKNLCSGWQFGGLQRNPSLDQSQRTPDSITSNAPANRVKFRGEVMELRACFWKARLIEFFEQAHQTSTKSGQVRSRSEIRSTLAGQAIWNAGSSQRTPRAESALKTLSRRIRLPQSPGRFGHVRKFVLLLLARRSGTRDHPSEHRGLNLR